VFSSVEQRPGRWGIGVVVVVAVLVGVLLQHSGSVPKNFAVATGFGGYNLSGPVTEISAEIRVPTTSSLDGDASSWVGLQQGYKVPFIQVGVTEQGGNFDQVFWSSSAAGFHPQFIEVVQPGQLIMCAITRDSGGTWSWSVSGVGLKSLSEPFPQFQGASFHEAEWLQEDPAIANSVVDTPYPLFSQQVDFSHLRWNNEVPTLTLADGRTMFPNGGPVEVPSPIVDSSFSFHSPTGRAAVYMALARRFDDGYAPIDFDLKYWADQTQFRRQHDIAAYISLTTSFDTSMTALKWSASTRHSLQQLVALEDRMKGVMRT
jgi:hypothetical protein